MTDKNKSEPQTAPETPSAEPLNASPSPDEISDLKAQLTELNEKYLRACADLENQRKRHAREREEFVQYGLAGFMSALLPFVDNFKLALKKAQELAPEAKETLDGFALLLPQLDQILSHTGLTVIHPLPGESFDPNLHQSTGMAPSDQIAEHAIHSTLREGYQIRDRVLRPAFVLLSSGRAPNAEGKKE
jgi:molecular chaperone GrpE